MQREMLALVGIRLLTLENIHLKASYYAGMTQNMDMTAMAKIFFSKTTIDFKKWY